METVIDWSEAPADCIGALAAKVGNIHFPRVTFAKSVIHEHGRVRGESCDGDQLCAYLDLWIWEDRPWTGEGLPPVGTVCEMSLFASNKWELCLPVHYLEQPADHSDQVVVYQDSLGGEVCYILDPPCSGSIQFRPIRTPEQIAAEEREAEIEVLRVLLSKVACDDYHAAVAVFEAGYRKQVTP
jgi:hypothetical protein